MSGASLRERAPRLLGLLFGTAIGQQITDWVATSRPGSKRTIAGLRVERTNETIFRVSAAGE